MVGPCITILMTNWNESEAFKTEPEIKSDIRRRLNNEPIRRQVRRNRYPAKCDGLGCKAHVPAGEGYLRAHKGYKGTIWVVFGPCCAKDHGVF